MEKAVANKRTNAAYATCYEDDDEYHATPPDEQEEQEDDDGLEEYNKYMEALTAHRAADDLRKDRL